MRQVVITGGQAALEVDGEAAGAWCVPPPVCLERRLPGLGSTWVHGYTGADARRWKNLAFAANGHQPPAEWQLALAQVVVVCRTGPGAEAPSFRLDAADVEAGFKLLHDALPPIVVEHLCRESDALTLSGYVPAPAGEPAAREAAQQRLGEKLAEPEFWAHLDYLSNVLFGVPLGENGQPLAEVLSAAEREVDWRHHLVTALTMVGAAGGLR